MAGSAARNTTAGNTMLSYGTPGGAAGMASNAFPNISADPSVASFAGDVMEVMPMAPLAAGKGGTSGQPAMPTPPPSASAPAGPQYAPMAPQGNFNVNQASANALQQSMQGAQAGMGFQPGQIRPTGYQASTVGAGQLAGKDLDPYTNPYENQVVQQTLSDLGGAQEQQLNQMGAQASAANAFGGSRHGIAEAETRKGFADKATQAVSGLRQAGFTQAQQAAQADINTAQQAAMANMGARNVASQYGAGNQMLSQQQNIANQIAAQNMRMGAGSQLGQLGQQAFNTGQTIQQNQQQQGLMQQGLQQALIDAARGQYAGYTGAPNAALSAPLAALGVTPTPQSTTASKQPGLFDYLSLGATAAGMSDTRLKTDIKPIGTHKGINLYTWNWNDEGKRIADPAQPTIGVMAQELRETHPHLVEAGDDGYLRVNYAGLNSELEAA